MLAQKDSGDSSDIDSDNEISKTAIIGGKPTSKSIEGRAQAIARYTAKDPAGRDIDLEKGEVHKL